MFRNMFTRFVVLQEADEKGEMFFDRGNVNILAQLVLITLEESQRDLEEITV